MKYKIISASNQIPSPFSFSKQSLHLAAQSCWDKMWAVQLYLSVGHYSIALMIAFRPSIATPWLIIHLLQGQASICFALGSWSQLTTEAKVRDETGKESIAAKCFVLFVVRSFAEQTAKLSLFSAWMPTWANWGRRKQVVHKEVTPLFFWKAKCLHSWALQEKLDLPEIGAI